MKLPTTYKGFAKLLIAIAENGNPYAGDLTDKERKDFGAIIADIQNGLGELNETTLKKLNLFYDASK